MGGGGAEHAIPSTASDQQHAPATAFTKLVGHKNFVRHNPRSDKFHVIKFHHVEFWCHDATNTYNRFSWGLGMSLVAKSDQSTGNTVFASYVLRSNDLVFTFTAPYSRQQAGDPKDTPLPWYDGDAAYEFLKSHGLAVRAVGLLVGDAREAYDASVANGAHGAAPPHELVDKETGKRAVVAEVKLYGDVVLRYVSGDFEGVYLPNYQAVAGAYLLCFGLQCLDHAVGNVPRLLDTVNYIATFTGFHEFAEFIAEDVGTTDSGLNSMVLANNSELVLLPVNEPTFGTKRKSQIQTYLEQNEGPGLQHLALKTHDIFATLREMRQRSGCGGFEFMPRPSAEYYKRLPARIGDTLSAEQYQQVEELGILVDRDDQGVLLQLFTRPLGDRPTVFIEVIQRVGCLKTVTDPTTGAEKVEQAGGCGGFGKGNFSELFKSIEEYERTINV